MTDPLLALTTGIVALLVGLFLLGVATRGLLSRHPVPLDSTWIVALMAASTAPLFVSLIQPSLQTGVLRWIATGLALGALGYLWLRRSDLWLLGISHAGLTSALVSAGARGADGGVLEFPSQGARLHVSAQTLGTAQVRVDPPELRAEIVSLVTTAARQVPTTGAALGLCAILGAALAGCGLTLLYAPSALGGALGLNGTSKETATIAYFTVSAVCTGVLVSVRLCEEHIVCGLALVGLFLWAFWQ